MNINQKKQIKMLREAGHSYGSIARLLHLNENAVKTHCRRNGLNGFRAISDSSEDYCENCGMEIIQKTLLFELLSHQLVECSSGSGEP